jgi:cytochrome c peroxidase
MRIKFVVLTLFVCFGFAVFVARVESQKAAGRWAAVTLTPPTGVVASDGDYADSVGIRWDAIRDASLYRIYRNTTNNSSTAADVGTTAANYFFDTTAVTSQVYFFWVRAENGETFSQLSSPDQGNRAVGDAGGGAFSPLVPPPTPEGNPVTAAKAYLGKTLFWDEQLSSTKTVACGTCHRPASGGSDPRTNINDPRSRNPGPDGLFNTLDDIFGSPGVIQNSSDGNYYPNALFGMAPQVTGRKAPTYLNAGYSALGIFWDGRATDAFHDQLTNNVLLTSFAALESQSAGPPVSSAEMAHMGRNWTQVAARIQASRPLALASSIPTGLKTWIGGRTYPELFQEAFGTPDVTPARISMAIATHERAIFSDQTPFDRFAAKIQQLEPNEENGKELYLIFSCDVCHGGPVLSDGNFHNIGVRPQAEDRGRAAVTGRQSDEGAFKSPSLRNVELRSPYMHNGRFATLEDVVDFYDRGGDFDAPNIERNLIRPLHMTPAQKADLLAFLKRPLTDLRVKNELPPFDRPQLFTESERVPQLSGAGRAGIANAVPVAIAIEPPLVGNANFNFAVTTSIRSGTAVLVISDTDPGLVASIPTAGTFARVAVPLVDSGLRSGYASANIAIPNDQSLVGRTFYGRWYVQDPRARHAFGISRRISFTVFRGATDAFNVAPFDFDGDGRTDLSVFRRSEGKWAVNNSATNSVTEINLGLAADRLVPADYDGDGRCDFGVFREGVWYLERSSQGTVNVHFGLPDDIPQPGDYDGDGLADPAVFRPSNGVWYILGSSAGFRAYSFGLGTDKPVAADYDGDGKTDMAVYRDGVWHIFGTTAGISITQFGLAGDKPVVGDYDGDKRADIALWRPSDGTWYLMRSSDGAMQSVRFGLASDTPSPGDYDGDGRADPAVFRNGQWFVQESTTSAARTSNWGVAADASVPAAYIP